MRLNLPSDISSEQVDILVCGSEERSGLEMEADVGGVVSVSRREARDPGMRRPSFTEPKPRVLAVAGAVGTLMWLPDLGFYSGWLLPSLIFCTFLCKPSQRVNPQPGRDD